MPHNTENEASRIARQFAELTINAIRLAAENRALKSALAGHIGKFPPASEVEPLDNLLKEQIRVELERIVLSIGDEYPEAAELIQNEIERQSCGNASA